MITYPNLSWRIPDLSPPPLPLVLDQTEVWRAEKNFFWNRSISGSGSPSLDPPLLTFLDLHHHLALSNNCFIFIQNISLSLIGSNTSANSWQTVRFPVNGYSCVNAKGPVIIYRLGGRGRILGGITWFLGEKGGSVVTENPKGGIAKNFGRIQVTFKGRVWLNFTLFSLKSFAPPPPPPTRR